MDGDSGGGVAPASVVGRIAAAGRIAMVPAAAWCGDPVPRAGMHGRDGRV